MIIHSFALSLLLGFELSYYLLIVQTGIAAHYNSDLITLFPMFIGGVAGTILGGVAWGSIQNPIHKILIALSLQLGLSFLYPNYTFFTLMLLGLAVGVMAPLGIYLFKAKQQKELLFALAIAYSVGTFLFTSDVHNRIAIAASLSAVALVSAFVLRGYKVALDAKEHSYPFAAYLPLMLWIFLDSNLFETLSRHENINIWSNCTFTIIAFHLLGLVAAYVIKASKLKKHLFIALLFFGSYTLSYLEASFMLSMLYPFTISYYNVVVFTVLSKEQNIAKLSFMMVFVGWIASGAGLMLALSKLLH
ncbi:MAG: hypothetical protein PHX44_09180 [Sulfurimonas sp.]|uniref:hypothetical protein n=1 Tax=Sulfurimonas sp. TaxID=2022749 RepID=UPI002638ECB9|nr:hypothetical protein [Sulfurimonas sp.]MDD2653206.1 hypothetical protein [Sulfurimonas sp.]MDD3452531.1 hypothetical protein [Sulfurimonas sp.]